MTSPSTSDHTLPSLVASQLIGNWALTAEMCEVSHSPAPSLPGAPAPHLQLQAPHSLVGGLLPAHSLIGTALKALIVHRSSWLQSSSWLSLQASVAC